MLTDSILAAVGSGAEAGTDAAEAAAGKVADGDGTGEPSIEAAVDPVCAGTSGWLYFCQASQSMTSESEKTNTRIRRRVSMNGLCS